MIFRRLLIILLLNLFACNELKSMDDHVLGAACLGASAMFSCVNILCAQQVAKVYFKRKSDGIIFYPKAFPGTGLSAKCVFEIAKMFVIESISSLLLGALSYQLVKNKNSKIFAGIGMTTALFSLIGNLKAIKLNSEDWKSISDMKGYFGTEDGSIVSPEYLEQHIYSQKVMLIPSSMLALVSYKLFNKS